MNWYNYGDQWVNMEHVEYIEVVKQMYPNQKDGLNVFFYFPGGFQVIRITPNESDAEFEKIKQLMGVSQKEDWTPGRCC